MRRETVEAEGLTGVLTWPAGDPAGALVLAHCFTCSKDHPVMVRVAQGLAEAGYASLRHQSAEDATLSQQVEDVERAVAHLADRAPDRIGVFGHSFGGVAALIAAERSATVGAVAVVNVPSTAQHLRGALAHVEDEVLREGTARVEVAGRMVTLSAELFDDLACHDLEARVAALGRPLLVLQSRDDAIVDPSEAEALMLAAHEPKTLVMLDGDHLLTAPQMKRDAVAALTAWLREVWG